MTFIYKRSFPLIAFINGCLCTFPAMSQVIDKDSAKLINKTDIVNIAYATQPAWKVTGAISSVKGEELGKSFTSNLSNTLFGRLSGLTAMQGSGEPGTDGATLQARGINTFGPGSAPLIIIDGFEGSYQQLIPDEITTVELLKDASATAMYGMRGANGVLLVTTKRGNTGQMVVNFNAQAGFQQAMRLPAFLNAANYAALFNEALDNDGKPAKYTNEDIDAYKKHNDPYFHPDVNWYNEVLRKTAPIYNFDLNFSGGSKDVQYFVLLNAIKSGGLYRQTEKLSDISTNSKYARYNFRTNVDAQLTKRMSVNFTLGGSVEDWANPVNATTASTFDLMASLPPNSFPVHNPDGSYGGSALYTNPYGNLLETGSYTSNGRTLQTTLKLTEQLDMITKGLSISGAISFNSYFRNYSNKTRQYAQYGISKNAAGDTVYTKYGQNTSLVDDEGSSSQWRNFAGQAFLNYDRSFAQHNISTMLMYNADSYNISGDAQPYKHMGTAGRFTYTNNEKYIGEFSFGYNGSENFAKGNRFGFFPAVSLGWIASKEAFLRDSKLISFLKLRASYGMVGNDQIGGQRFMFDQYYPYTSGYNFGTQNGYIDGITEGSIANPGVTWEKQKQLNIGLEATLLNRLQINLDLFNQDRYDILALPNRTIPQYSGMVLPQTNVGKANNKGFELSIRYNSDAAKKFQYFVGLNTWYAKNKIVYSSEPFKMDDYLYATGRPIGQPFVLQSIGFFKDAADIQNSPQQIFGAVRPGDLKYKDQNNDGVIDLNDVAPIGKTNMPQLTMGLNAGFSYAGFDLNLFAQAVSGRTVYLSGNYFQAFQNNGQISSIALGRWTPETVATATYPRLSSTNNQNNFQSSSFWQRNGSFLKLRSVELGYTVTGSMLKKIKISKARFFINATNLFSLDHMNKFTDPETVTGYPAMRTISAGFKVQI